MTKRLIMLVLVYLVTMQDIRAMDKLTLQCPKAQKSLTVMAWLFSPFGGNVQAIKGADQEAQDALQDDDPKKLVAIPGKVTMDAEVKTDVYTPEDASKRPPTPFYAYPGGPPLPPSPELGKSQRCTLKTSLDWFPCGHH